MKKMRSCRSGLTIAAALLGLAGLAGCGGGSSQTTYALSGTVSGLTGGTLQLSDGYSLLNLAADGSFLFPLRLATGNTYNVFVQQQPADLTCRVTNGTGTTASSDITNVQVNCVANRTLSGTVTGLTTSGLVLVNGSDKVTVNGSSTTAGGISFTFPTKVGNGFAYGVTILQPAPQPCTVQQGSGVANGDVNNVLVVCQ